jgi:hypothetical protein
VHADGARSIPAIILIGPEGEVVGKGLLGEQVKEIVAKILGRN